MTYCTLDLKLINITGDDAQDFLQGQLTANLKALEDKRAIFCGHCNLKGRLVSLGYLFKNAEGFGYAVPGDISDIAVQKLQKYVMRSKVQFKISGQSLYGGWSQDGIQIDSTRSLHLDRPSGDEVDHSQWRLANVEAEMAWLDADTVGAFLPSDINLSQHGGVSLTKGCFIGQEIVARMHYLGKTKKQIMAYESENLELKPLDRFTDERVENAEVVCHQIVDAKNHMLIICSR